MASPGAIAGHDDSNCLDFLRLWAAGHQSIRRALTGINFFLTLQFLLYERLGQLM